MKKVITATVLLFFCSVPAYAENVYVKSLRAKIMSKPSLKSKVLNMAPRGSVLEIINRSGRWVNVSYMGKEGWVSKYLISKRPPMKRVSLLAKGKSIQKSARRRASAFTSVAAARGLTDEARARKGMKVYAVDFDALERMENFQIDETEAVRFIEEGVGR